MTLARGSQQLGADRPPDGRPLRWSVRWWFGGSARDYVVTLASFLVFVGIPFGWSFGMKAYEVSYLWYLGLVPAGLIAKPVRLAAFLGATMVVLFGAVILSMPPPIEPQGPQIFSRGTHVAIAGITVAFFTTTGLGIRYALSSYLSFRRRKRQSPSIATAAKGPSDETISTVQPRTGRGKPPAGPGRKTAHYPKAPRP